MERKRSVGLNLLILYLALSGVFKLGALFGNITSLFFPSLFIGIISLVCACGLYLLKEWGRKLTILHFSIAIMYLVIHSSPIMHENKKVFWQGKYEQIVEKLKDQETANYGGVKVPKEKFLIKLKEKLDAKYNKKSSYIDSIPSSIVWLFLIILINRRKFKEQFK